MIPSTHCSIVCDLFDYLSKKAQKDANGKKGLVVINLTGSNQLGFGVDIGKSSCCDVRGVESEIRVFRTCSIFIYAPIVRSFVETPSEALPVVLIKCPGRCVKLSKLLKCALLALFLV